MGDPILPRDDLNKRHLAELSQHGHRSGVSQHVQCRLAEWVPDWRERQSLSARQDEIIAANCERWMFAFSD